LKSPSSVSSPTTFLSPSQAPRTSFHQTEEKETISDTSLSTPSPLSSQTTGSSPDESSQQSTQSDLPELAEKESKKEIAPSESTSKEGHPEESRIRVLLWVVKHLANQFGVTTDDIVRQFSILFNTNPVEETT